MCQKLTSEGQRSCGHGPRVYWGSDKRSEGGLGKVETEIDDCLMGLCRFRWEWVKCIVLYINRDY